MLMPLKKPLVMKPVAVAVGVAVFVADGVGEVVRLIVAVGTGVVMLFHPGISS